MHLEWAMALQWALPYNSMGNLLYLLLGLDLEQTLPFLMPLLLLELYMKWAACLSNRRGCYRLYASTGLGPVNKG